MTYNKATRDIISAVRRRVLSSCSHTYPNYRTVGGGSADPEKNSALAAILRRLKDIPKENIQNALDKVVEALGPFYFTSPLSPAHQAIRKRDQRGENIVYEVLAYNKVGLIM
jgi:transcriptional/translational regulatory protein YebC/TACO1